MQKLIKFTKDSEFSEFLNYLISQGLSKTRIYRYLCCLKKFKEFLNKSLKRVSKKDIENFLIKIELSDYSPYTKREYKQTLKKYYKFIKKEHLIKDIKVSLKYSERKLPEIISEEEIFQLVNSCKNLRDKALISLLYESGARIGEIINLRKDDVIFDDVGCLIRVKGKTGERVIRCIFSAKYLKEWIKNVKDYLWISKSGKKLSYDGIRKIIKRRSKILNKRVYPYIFRHSRLTYLAKYLTDQQLCEFAGWIGGSKMARVYVHLSSRDIEEKIKELYIKCPNCGNLTQKGKRCFICGKDLYNFKD
jgi:site-specific recombinase XerD